MWRTLHILSSSSTAPQYAHRPSRAHLLHPPAPRQSRSNSAPSAQEKNERQTNMEPPMSDYILPRTIMLHAHTDGRPACYVPAVDAFPGPARGQAAACCYDRSSCTGSPSCSASTTQWLPSRAHAAGAFSWLCGTPPRSSWHRRQGNKKDVNHRSVHMRTTSRQKKRDTPKAYVNITPIPCNVDLLGRVGFRRCPPWLLWLRRGKTRVSRPTSEFFPLASLFFASNLHGQRM